MAFHHKLSLYLREALAKHSIKLVGIPQGREEPAKGHGAIRCPWPRFLCILVRLDPSPALLGLSKCMQSHPSCHPQSSLSPHPETPVPHMSTAPLCFQPQEHSAFFPWGNLQLSVLKVFNIPWSTHIWRLLFPLLLQIGTAYPVYTISIILLITLKV